VTTRVAIVSASAVPGGAERALTGLVRHLPAVGVEPFVILLQSGAFEEWLAEVGCPTVILRAGRTRQIHRTIGAVAQIRRVAVERGADVVLSSQSKSHVYGGTAALLARLPAVWWQHAIPRRGRIEFVAGRVPAAAVVCGSRAAEKAQHRLTPRRTIVRIPPGVDVSALAARRGSGTVIRRSLGWEGRRIVGIVGRLEPSKGQRTFLQAASLLARGRPDVRFAVIGGAVLGWEGSYPDDLRRLAAELGLADRVHFAGHQDDVAPWLDAFDVAVHAADNEPFGLVLVEAMALGKPLVASASGGPMDIVEDGVSGLLVAPGDAHTLAARVDDLLDDPALASRLGRAGADRAQRFTEERTAAAFGQLLSSITAGEPERRFAPAPSMNDR
jgi:glycosyltransferase involved in cell wall biosynthesis